jgi:uncharacterized protein
MESSQFDMLLSLQALDLELDALTDREANLHERDEFEKLKQSSEVVEKALVNDETLLRKEKVVQKKYEDAIAAISAKIEKEQGRLYGGAIANPKELAGIQQEIASLGERRDEEETALLEQMEVVEPMERETAVLKERLESIRAQRDEAKATFDRVHSEITASLKELSSKRSAAAAAVGKEQLEPYERVRKKHKKAVTGVEGGVCQGCHTEIPAMELSAILAKPGLAKCPNCGRLLVK